MDGYVQLALIEKAKRIFAIDEQLFLSFPVLSPISFAPETLPAILAPESPSDYAMALDFARIANFIPRDMVAMADGETFLWDIFADVLDRAEPGSAPPDPTKQAAHAAAQALLYSIDSDGLRHDTPAYVEYRRYRDAWFVAQQDYAAQKITATTTTDPALQQQWTQVDEPRLRAAIAQVEADWESKGHRTQIEAALADDRTAAANDPGGRWADWRAGFNPDLDMLGDPGARFAPTGFSPVDLSDDSSWLQAEMDTAEIDALAAAAPVQLHVAGETSDVDHVSFEFRSVTITRPWFNSAALTSRIWRDAPGQEDLSDGGDPPSGRLPAYVSAIVFIRNVVVTPKNVAVPQTTVPFQFTLAAQMMTRRAITADPGLLLRMRTPVPVPADPPPPSVAKAFARMRLQNFSTVEVARERPAMMFRRAAMVSLQPTPAVSAAASTRLSTFANRLAIRRGPMIFRPNDAQAAPAPPPPPPPPPDKTIAVLAFICKKMPRTPDPLPGLSWT